MKPKKYLLLLTLPFFVAVFSQQAQAFLAEPYLGLKSATLGENKQVNGLDVDFGDNLAGGLVGFRLGTEIAPTLSGGLDFTLGYLEHLDGYSSTEDVGVFLEHKFRVPLRVWLTYFVSSMSAEIENAREASTGQGTKFGLGYSGWGQVSINIEFHNLSYDLTEVERFDPAATELGSVLLSISAPMTF